MIKVYLPNDTLAFEFFFFLRLNILQKLNISFFRQLWLETKCYIKVYVFSIQLAYVKTKSTASENIQKKIASTDIVTAKAVLKDTDKSANTPTIADHIKRQKLWTFYREKEEQYSTYSIHDFKNHVAEMNK